MSEKKTKKTGASVDAAPSFFKWQLVGCKKLEASADVINAVLRDDRKYTLAEAREEIKQFLNRKV